MFNPLYEDQSNTKINHIGGYSQCDETFFNAEELDMELAFSV